MLTRQRVDPASLTCNTCPLCKAVRTDDDDLANVYHEFWRNQITAASRTACAPAQPVRATVRCHMGSSPIHVRGTPEDFDGVVARGRIGHACCGQSGVREARNT
jgi:hypothetical protein